MGSVGLGLSLCRQLMEEQDGQIEATYEEEEVVFTLIFGNGIVKAAGKEATDEEM
jgi:nitrogen-specific signal transduction histidine kinase